MISNNPIPSTCSPIVSPIPEKTFTYPDHLRLFIFSYLTGFELFDKIAVTSKAIRNELPISGLLDQDKVIALNEKKDKFGHTLIPIDSFRYGIQLATSIQVNTGSLEHAMLVFNFMRFASSQK